MAPEIETPEEAAETASIGNHFDYPLITPIEYASGGTPDVVATFIRFIAPTSKHRKECGWLRQALSRALSDAIVLGQKIQATRTPEQMEAILAAVQAQKDGKDDEEKKKKSEEIEPMSGDTAIGVISTSASVDLDKVIEVSRRLFISTPPATAFLDGEQKLTSPLYDKLSYDDVEKMTGEYLGRFFGGSVLKTLSAL